MDSQDRTALMEQWYRQYAPLLFHYARQFVDYHAAEEVVQETFRIAWEAIQQREVQYLLSGADALPEDEWEDPVDVELEYDGFISRRDLHLLKRLAVDGCTYAEAAQELHTTAEACRKRAARAKQLLRKLLEE